MIRPIINKTDLPRQNGILSGLKQLLDIQNLSLLDLGCGSGRLASRLKLENPDWTIEGVDVVIQPDCAIPVTSYDGYTIPFADNSFDVVLCVDMLHHSHNPELVLQEAARVAKNWVIIKDHESNSQIDYLMLRGLDWLGNAGTGVPMPYNFLSTTQWQHLFKETALEEVEKLAAIRYWPGVIGQLVDRKYHFISKLKPASLAR